MYLSGMLTLARRQETLASQINFNNMILIRLNVGFFVTFSMHYGIDCTREVVRIYTFMYALYPVSITLTGKNKKMMVSEISSQRVLAIHHIRHLNEGRRQRKKTLCMAYTRNHILSVLSLNDLNLSHV